MRFAIFETGTITEPEFVQKYGSFGELFINLLDEPGHHWDTFDVQKQDYPQSLDSYDGIVITGSPATAADPLPWIQRLNQEIVTAHQQGKKILGVCFGHQAVANALGGRSEVNPKGWEVGVHEVQLNPAMKQLPYAADVGESLHILEVHRDHVAELPSDAVNQGRTDNTPNQIYTIGNTVLCLQGHPEYFNDVIANLVDKRVDYGIIPADVGKAAKSSLENLQPQRDLLQTMLKRFLYQ